MSRCNFCYLRDFQKVAARAGGVVELEFRPSDFAPEGVNVRIRYLDQDEPTWCAWFMKLPDHCVC